MHLGLRLISVQTTHDVGLFLVEDTAKHDLATPKSKSTRY